MTPASGHDTIISPGGSTPISRERAVHLVNVRKTFGADKTEVKALRGIDLDVPASTLTMLVGPSGCGKTTLVSIMSGVLDADHGSHAEIFGVEWSRLNNDQRARRRSELVGFVFQQFNLIPTLTVLENTSVPLLVRGLRDRDARARAAEALTDVGLGDRLASMPSQLSGGMQQRVAIARALVGRPRLLVCDEPTAALDGKTGQHIMDLIHAASRAGDDQGRPRCVIVVTHDNRIFHYADRIIEMEDGRLKSTLSKHTVEESQHIPTYDEDNNKQGK